MSEASSVSVVLPAFNEAGALEAVVRRADGVLAALGRTAEIIVVNDGSTDETAAIADGLRRELTRVRVVHHAQNAGYGAAQRSGIQAAGCDLVCIFPSDGQVPPEELLKYVAAAPQADVVAGRYRMRPDLVRRWLSRGYVLALRLLFGVRLRNVNAPKMYRREQVQAVDITAHGGFADAQIVIELQRRGCRFVEIDVECGPRLAGRSSIGAAAAVEAFRELWRFYRGGST